MVTKDEQLYTITFHGECNRGYNKNDVMNHFANIFKVNVRVIEGIFTGKSIFIKRDLNYFSADQYKKILTSIGAKYECKLQSNNKLVPTYNNSELSDKKICPKCDHEQINNFECESCGIIFNKYSDKQKPININKKIPDSFLDSSEKEQEEDIQDSETVAEHSSAVKSIKFGSLLMVCIFLIDTMLQTRGIDIGYIPYLISNIFFAYGGLSVAKNKNYPHFYGLLGLGNLIGLSILYLLPDKGTITEPYQINKVRATAIFVILVGIFWSYSNIQKNSQIKQYVNSAQAFPGTEFQYPSKNLFQSEMIFEDEMNKTKNFMNEGFTLLDSLNPTPNEFHIIINTLFEDISGLLVWVQYQQFLHSSITGKIPEFLQEDNIKLKKDELSSLLHDLLNKYENKHNNDINLVKARQTWFFGCSEWNWAVANCDYSDSSRSLRLQKILSNIEIVTSDRKRILYYKKKYPDYSQELPVISKPPKDFVPSMTISDTTIEEGVIYTIHFANNGLSEMSGKTLVLVNYLKPNTSKHRRTDYSDIFVCIGGNLSQKFLANSFSVVKELHLSNFY